jgi:hypothetical protein
MEPLKALQGIAIMPGPKNFPSHVVLLSACSTICRR